MKTNDQQPNTSMADALAQASNAQAQKNNNTIQPGAAQPQQTQVPPVQQQAPQQPAYQPQGNAQQQQPVFGGAGFNAQQQVPQGDRQSKVFGLNARRVRTFSAQSYSENFKAAQEAVNKYCEPYENQGFNKSFFIIPLQDTNLHCAALIYALAVSGNMVVAYTYMLENTGSPLKPMSGNDPMTQERYELAKMTGSQYDDIYWRAVQAKVVLHLKLGENVQVLEGGAGVVHSEMDWTDTSAISKLLNNAENACMAFANRQTGYNVEPPLNLALDVNQNVDRLAVSFNFNPQPLYTADGQPQRNDVEIKMTVASEGDVQVQNVEPFTTVNGYVELVAAGGQPQMIQGPYGQMMPAPQRYYPQLAITHISQGISNAEGPEFQILGFYVATLLLENNNWMNAFSPRMVNGVDINDIGALNYELRMGVDPADPNARPKKIDTKSHDFNPMALQQLLGQACFPNMSVVMDIEETGHRNWVNSMFLQAGGAPQSFASALTVEGRMAHDAIIAAANNLTNSKFSEFYTDTTQLITIRDGSRIPGGYYLSDDGKRLDNRNVDLIAVLNFLGESDPRKVEEWKMICSSTSGLSGPKRIALRQQFLQTILGASYVQKCYYERVMISAYFLKCLREAVVACGLQVRPENMSNQYNAMSYGQPLAAMYGMNTNMASSLTNANYQVDNYGRVIPMGGYRTAYGTYQAQ